jgi:hypothetical protein
MLIKFLCNNPDCGNNIIKLFKGHREIPPFLDCGSCGSGKLERQLGAPSSKSTQIIDNGLQAKKIEILNETVLKEQEKLSKE